MDVRVIQIRYIYFPLRAPGRTIHDRKFKNNATSLSMWVQLKTKVG